MTNGNRDEQGKLEGNLSGALRQIFALTESYPNLKADTQFINLQNQLQSIELEISQARKYYNGVVKSFNTSIQLFPASIVANSMKLEKVKYFELDSPEERKNVKVEF
jgi:LemA protein